MYQPSNKIRSRAKPPHTNSISARAIANCSCLPPQAGENRHRGGRPLAHPQHRRQHHPALGLEKHRTIGLPAVIVADFDAGRRLRDARHQYVVDDKRGDLLWEHPADHLTKRWASTTVGQLARSISLQ
jgi:hypothetical protein